MSGLELFDGDTKLRITYEDRTVLTTDGTLINLLPQAMDISETFDIAFPDFTKDYLYNWRHVFEISSLAGLVGQAGSCATALTVVPQEFANEANIVAAPADADIFVGSLVLTRTVNPDTTWSGSPIQPLQPMGVAIPFISGSLLMEAAFGMARACSIYVSGGQLKLHRQQSISTPPGGWGLYGTSYNDVSPAAGSGGENVFGSKAGIPVVQVNSRSSPGRTYPLYSPVAPSFDDRCRRGKGMACTIPNPASYNFRSTYQAVLTGSFGRRS